MLPSTISSRRTRTADRGCGVASDGADPGRHRFRLTPGVPRPPGCTRQVEFQAAPGPLEAATPGGWLLDGGGPDRPHPPAAARDRPRPAARRGDGLSAPAARAVGRGVALTESTGANAILGRMEGNARADAAAPTDPPGRHHVRAELLQLSTPGRSLGVVRKARGADPGLLPAGHALGGTPAHRLYADGMYTCGLALCPARPPGDLTGAPCSALARAGTAGQVIDYENLLRGQMQEIINLMRLEGAEVHLPPVRVRPRSRLSPGWATSTGHAAG